MAVFIDIKIDGYEATPGFPVVRKLTATEEMSRCYHYDVLVEIPSVDIDKLDSLGRHAWVTYSIGNEPASAEEVHTVETKVAEIVQVTSPETAADYARFRLQLFPPFWFRGLTKKTRIFKDSDLLWILDEQLANAGIKYEIPEDFIADLHQPRPMTCQYNESDLIFLSRLMEDRGVYYFFDHSDGGKLVISDSSNQYKEGQGPIYEPGTWSVIRRAAPTRVILSAYDYSNPSNEIVGDFKDPEDPLEFEVYLDDEPVVSQEEANALAEIRLQQLRMMSRYVTFRSFSPGLVPGFTFSKGDETYVVTQVQHTFVHEDGKNGGESNYYRNSVIAIRADIPFRPERKTGVPRVQGTETAHIHTEDESGLAMVDEQGRYTVKLNYLTDKDLLPKKDNLPTLSKLRMQQPAAGEHDGVYFPLKNGVEVVVAFHKGNPDLPYIHGAMSNGQFPSHVKGEGEGAQKNPHHSVIKANHTLVTRALGGSHSMLTVAGQKTDNIKFPLLNDNGTKAGDMDQAEEELGEFHVERLYGNKYVHVRGSEFIYGAEGSTYVFGSQFTENHEKVDFTDSEQFDLDARMGQHFGGWAAGTNGLVEKTWGDQVQYTCGRSMTYAEWQPNAGDPFQSYNYGSRYSENHFQMDGGLAQDWMGAERAWGKDLSGFVENTQGDIYNYHLGNLEEKSEGSITSTHLGDVTETVTGSMTFTQVGTDKTITNSYEATEHTDHYGEVSETYHRGTDTEMWGASADTYYGASNTFKLGLYAEDLLGGRATFEAAAALEIFASLKETINFSARHEFTKGKVIYGSKEEVTSWAKEKKNISDKYKATAKKTAEWTAGQAVKIKSKKIKLKAATAGAVLAMAIATSSPPQRRAQKPRPRIERPK